MARPLVGLVRATLTEAPDPLKGATPGLARTTGVAEWLGRRFTRRMRLIHVFLGDAGPDRFVALFALSVNFHRDHLRRERTRHSPDPGMCPREIAGQTLQIAVGDDPVVASWLDALEISPVVGLGRAGRRHNVVAPKQSIRPPSNTVCISSATRFATASILSQS